MIVERLYLVMREIRGGMSIPESVALTKDRAVLECCRLATVFYRANGEAPTVTDGIFDFPESGVTFRTKPIKCLDNLETVT